MKKLRLAILAMASDRKYVANRLADVSGQCLEHLACIAMYPESDNTAHWYGELYALLHRVYKLKQNNRFPPAQFIFDNTWGVCGDTLDSIIKATVEDYGTPQSDSSVEAMTSEIEDYFHWLSENLSKFGTLSKTAIYRRLDKMVDNLSH